MALNHKLQTFVDVWDGDFKRCATIAGISEQYARRLMMSTESPGSHAVCKLVQEAITQRNAIENRAEIANRRERQRFWSAIQRGEQIESEIEISEDGKETRIMRLPVLSDRLRASELLGKSEADFVDVVKSEHTMRLCLGAPRKAVEAEVLPEAPIEQVEAIEGSTEDKP